MIWSWESWRKERLCLKVASRRTIFQRYYWAIYATHRRNDLMEIFQELLPRPSNNTTYGASEEERRLDSEIWWRVPSLLDANHGHIMWRRNMWTFEMVTFYDTFHHSSASTYLNDMPWYSILGCQSLLCHDYQSSLLYEILYELLWWQLKIQCTFSVHSHR